MKQERQALNYRSEIAAAVHEMMARAHDAGLIGAKTMRRFDVSCLAAEASVEPACLRDETALGEMAEGGRL